MHEARDIEALDQALVESLSKQYRHVLQRYFMRRNLPAPDAEDLAQDVFVRLSRRRGLSEVENIAGYLFETASSVAIDYRRGRMQRYSQVSESYEESRHGLSDLAPDRVLAGREELNSVLTSLLELPERTRNVFILARLEQMRQGEIARRLGISVSAVEKHMMKAIAHLSDRVRFPR